MKRKADQADAPDSSKKRILPSHDVRRRFREGLLDQLEEYREKYAASKPYLHGVIGDTIDEHLLRRVRAEILHHLHFTKKETDIYKIHQSGDLANLDGLDDSSLSRLPSLLKLRDALYSSTFRHFISAVADSGPLSGKKTDMAINIYTPRCHLICHDDVIGSRRLSYILYLTDPDKPWRLEWGGALRLYATRTLTASDGSEAIIPLPEFSTSIPPSFNQLSFFTIQPGRSYHDVEEIYDKQPDDASDDGGRVRMAISGWFHIPQVGEDGYEEGLEERLAERSSLTQLQSKADEFDRPQPRWRTVEELAGSPADGPVWTASELEWLLQYIHPGHLVPERVEELSDTFRDSSVVTIGEFLSPRFANRLREYMSRQDTTPGSAMPRRAATTATAPTAPEDDDIGEAQPPHKHRFLYRHAAAAALLPSAAPTSAASGGEAESPLDELLDRVLPSPLFARWLALFTNLALSRGSFLARRFRRGRDYTLATQYDDESPQLELTLGITPSEGWGDDYDDGEGEEEDGDDGGEDGGDKSENGVSPRSKGAEDGGDGEDANVGGYEVYMVGDDEDEGEDDAGKNGGEASNTGAGQRKTKADPAVYRSTPGDVEDDGVLFSMPASWNNLSIVLRDKRLLRFVKYVSASAKGDRWDIVASFGVIDEDEDDDENESD